MALDGQLYRLPEALNDPILEGKLREADTPTLITLSPAETRRLDDLAKAKSHWGPRFSLRFLGGQEWEVPNDEAAGPVDSPPLMRTLYKSHLTGSDVICCGSPTEEIKPISIPKVSGVIRWRGREFTYLPVVWTTSPTSHNFNVLFDPKDGTFIVLRPPAAKPVWSQLPNP